MTKDESHNETRLTTQWSPVVSLVLEGPQLGLPEQWGWLYCLHVGTRPGWEESLCVEGHRVMDVRVKPALLTSYSFRAGRSTELTHL